MRTTKAVYERLAYAPDIGGSCLIWKVSPRYGIAPGDRAGSLTSKGYWQVFVDGKGYLAHRVVWALVHGAWPLHDLDHIDRDPSNNKIENLRCCLNGDKDNAQNQKQYRSNSSGFPGVFKVGSRFKAQLQVDKTLHYLGIFDTAEAAYAAYVNAKKVHHPFWGGDLKVD